MPTEKPSEELIQRGMEIARNANDLAYAPYSHFHVSVALYLEDEGDFVPGVNVENRSFGGTICAERSAFVSAISRKGSISPGFIVLYTRQESLTPPCGICLQFMSEFVPADFPVIMFNEKGLRRDARFDDLLPTRFEEF
jgi:cytidine deaminase